MPKLGDIQKGEDIGKGRGHKYIWAKCLDCGIARWVILRTNPPVAQRCVTCGNKGKNIGIKNLFWRGGVAHNRGYILVKVYPNDFFYPMTDHRGYVMEHRLVVAKALGRCLHRWEIVHHKHTKYPAGSIEDKQDNRHPENLQLVSDDRHKQISILERRISYLENILQKHGIKFSGNHI